MAVYPGTSLFPGSSTFPDSSGVVTTPLVPLTITDAGIVTGAGQAANPVGNVVLWNNGATTWIELVNTDSNPQQVTITLPYKVKGQTVPAIVIPLSAGRVHRRGPFDPSVYGQVLAVTASSSLVQIGVFQMVPLR